MKKTVTAGDLAVGDEVIESRLRGGRWYDLYFTVVAIDKGRFVNYRLSDLSDRILSPYIEVDVTGRRGLAA
jgi:hypothetical protein